MSNRISVSGLIKTSAIKAFDAFTSPDSITQWNQASPDWHCPFANVDLRIGGQYLARMEAKDGSFGFDFEGKIEELDEPKLIAIRLGDGRLARTTFDEVAEGVKVTTSFDPENSNPVEMQREGWQAILDSFVRHVEASRG